MTKIGILIYPNVEVLDFCGPFEVFRNLTHLNSDLDIEVATVSETSEMINAQGLLVVPTYTFANSPQYDILIVPGGAGMWLKEQKSYVDFVAAQYENMMNLVTVCTGALLVGKLGLLKDGMDATTHQEGIVALHELAPNANILPFVRFTHSQNIIMTGGISAGIDGSLYLVSQIWGENKAVEISKYMEYHWQIREPNQNDPALM